MTCTVAIPADAELWGFRAIGPLLVGLFISRTDSLHSNSVSSLQLAPKCSVYMIRSMLTISYTLAMFSCMFPVFALLLLN